jgi:hypothetical protein
MGCVANDYDDVDDECINYPTIRRYLASDTESVDKSEQNEYIFCFVSCDEYSIEIVAMLSLCFRTTLWRHMVEWSHNSTYFPNYGIIVGS